MICLKGWMARRANREDKRWSAPSPIDTLRFLAIGKGMIVKMTSKRQVTFPRQVVEKFSLKEGDALQISETPEGILIKPHRFDPASLAPLRGMIRPNLAVPDLAAIRHAYTLDPTLRD